MLSTIEDRVQNGINLLNKYFGNTDWVHRIDLNDFDMSSWRRCVIGQLFKDLPNDFSDGVDKLGLRHDHKAQAENGFEYALDEDRELDYSNLQTEWNKRIIGLRG